MPPHSNMKSKEQKIFDSPRLKRKKDRKQGDPDSGTVIAGIYFPIRNR